MVRCGELWEIGGDTKGKEVHMKGEDTMYNEKAHLAHPYIHLQHPRRTYHQARIYSVYNNSSIDKPLHTAATIQIARKTL